MNKKIDINDVHYKRIVKSIWNEGHKVGYARGEKQGQSVLSFRAFVVFWAISVVVSGIFGTAIPFYFDWVK